MPKTVILGTARTPFGKMGGGLVDPRRHRARRHRDRGRARARRRRARAGRARGHGPGAAGRPGPDPLAPGADQGRHPEGGLLGDDQQGLRLGHARDRSCSTRRSAPATSRSASAAAWSRCRRRPTCCPSARFGFRMGDAKALDAMIHDGLTNPFTGKQMFDEATEVGDELEITRPDLDRWALRSHELAIKATDEGRLPEEIVAVTVKGRKGDTVVEVDEAPRRDTHARGARQAAGPRRQGRHRTPPATRRASTTAPARSCSPPTSGPRANGKEALAEIVAHAAVGRRLRLPRHARPPAPRRRRSRRPA